MRAAHAASTFCACARCAKGGFLRAPNPLARSDFCSEMSALVRRLPFGIAGRQKLQKRHQTDQSKLPSDDGGELAGWLASARKGCVLVCVCGGLSESSAFVAGIATLFRWPPPPPMCLCVCVCVCLRTRWLAGWLEAIRAFGRLLRKQRTTTTTLLFLVPPTCSSPGELCVCCPLLPLEERRCRTALVRIATPRARSLSWTT